MNDVFTKIISFIDKHLCLVSRSDQNEYHIKLNVGGYLRTSRNIKETLLISCINTYQMTGRQWWMEQLETAIHCYNFSAWSWTMVFTFCNFESVYFLVLCVKKIIMSHIWIVKYALLICGLDLELIFIVNQKKFQN